MGGGDIFALNLGFATPYIIILSTINQPDAAIS
jgi:hypothetical protein